MLMKFGQRRSRLFSIDHLTFFIIFHLSFGLVRCPWSVVSSYYEDTRSTTPRHRRRANYGQLTTDNGLTINELTRPDVH
jgi:hypothetical protein